MMYQINRRIATGYQKKYEYGLRGACCVLRYAGYGLRGTSRVAQMEKLPSHTHDVVSLLADQHLLIKDRRGSENRERDIVEVAHEALLREWPLFSGWLEEEKDNIRAIGAVSRSATEWKKMIRKRNGLSTRVCGSMKR